MANALFGAGERVEINQCTGAIHSIDRVAAVILYDNNRRDVYSPEELFLMHRDGVLRVLPKEPADAPPDIVLTDTQIAKAERKEKFLIALDKEHLWGSDRVRQEVIARVANEWGLSAADLPSPITVYRDYRKWIENDRKLIALLPSQYPSPRAPRIPDEIWRLVDDTLFTHYLVRNGKKRAECYRILEREFRQAGRAHELPSKSTFYKHVSRFDPIEVVRCREGMSAARKKARRIKGGFFPKFLLERCELDAVHVKIGLLDEEGNYIGSAIVFLLIDCYSRAILGYSYTVGKRPAEQVADAIKCIKRALLPKEATEHPYLENPWPMHGKMVELVMDASPAFSVRTMTMFLARLGITRHTTPTKEPTRRAIGERFHRTFREQLLSTLPGYVGSRGNPREGEGTMEELACVKVSEFEQALVTYIVDGYHQSSHRALDDRTPMEVWDQHVEEHCPRPLLPSDMDYLRIFGGVMFEKKRLREVTGIELESIKYQSKALNELYWRLRRSDPKPTVMVLLDPYDVATITVIDPETGEPLEVDNVVGVPHGTTRREYKAQRLARKRPQRHQNPITRDHPIVQAAEQRQRDNERARRRRAHPDPDPMTPQSEDQLRKQLDLPSQQPEDSAVCVGDGKIGDEHPVEDLPPGAGADGNFRVE